MKKALIVTITLVLIYLAIQGFTDLTLHYETLSRFTRISYIFAIACVLVIPAFLFIEELLNVIFKTKE